MAEAYKQGCSCCMGECVHLAYLCDTCALTYMQDPVLVILTYGTAYYNYNKSIVSDDIFDKLCAKVLEEWDNIDSWYKDRYLTKGMLKTTSTFNAKYPRSAHSLFKYLTFKG